MCYPIRDLEGNVIGSYMPLFCFLLTGNNCNQEIKDTTIPCPKCGTVFVAPHITPASTEISDGKVQTFDEV